jgi:hypothetical protein
MPSSLTASRDLFGYTRRCLKINHGNDASNFGNPVDTSIQSNVIFKIAKSYLTMILRAHNINSNIIIVYSFVEMVYNSE